MGAELDVTVGALLIGVLVTAVGFGVTTLQTFLYMARFPNDDWTIRWMVWLLLLLDTAHVALSWHMTYYYLILNYNNPNGLEELVWSFDITVVITAIITMVVHCFYARRVHILSGRKWFITITILSLSLARLVFGCIVTVRVFQIKVIKDLSKKISGLVGGALGSGTLADCIITGTLTFYLQMHKSGFNTRTDNFVDKITYWTVNNGMLTSIVGIVVIITFSTMPHNMVFLAIHLFLSKLYANSLLATLNFRAAYHGRGVESDGSSLTMPSSLRAQLQAGPDVPQIALRTGKDTEVRPLSHMHTHSVSVLTVRASILCSRPVRPVSFLCAPVNDRRGDITDHCQSRNLRFVVPDSTDREYPSTGSDSLNKGGQEGIRYDSFDPDNLASTGVELDSLRRG